MPGLQLRTGSNLELNDLNNTKVFLVEAVVSHQSSLLSRSIKQSQFRSRYDAGVIAIHRNNERMQGKVGDIVLKLGDTLLLLAGNDFIEKQKRSNDFYVVSRLKTPEALQHNAKKGWLSILLLVTFIFLVSIGVFTMLKAMALAVVILLITRVIDGEEIKSNIQFEVLFVIACSLGIDRKSTRLNSSHVDISYAVFCLT